ncbi:hypothetical protein [Halotalea alkalilenta]|nr:hypothetical protein [Halotalea alkalilenta]
MARKDMEMIRYEMFLKQEVMFWPEKQVANKTGAIARQAHGVDFFG